MSDQQTNNFESGNSNNGNIMKELSDIKSSLATNTNETKNIKETVNEVKKVVNDMQSKYITQEHLKLLDDNYKKQFCDVKEISDDHEKRIRSNERNIVRILTWGSIVAFIISLGDILSKKWW
jgi:phage-related tail protein